LIRKTCLDILKCHPFSNGILKDVVSFTNQNANITRNITCMSFTGFNYPYKKHQPIQDIHIKRKYFATIQNGLQDKAVSIAQKGISNQPKLHFTERRLFMIGSREMCSGHGPAWPSRLGRVKIKREDRLRGSVDVLEDNNEEKLETKDIMNKVNTQIVQHSYGRLFAVVLMEKHQHKITSGDLLMCNHDVGASLGQVIRLEKSLLIGGKDFTLIGRPLLPRDAFRIVATVVEKNLSQHKICYQFKKRTKENNPKTRWARDFTTTLRINSIELIKPVDQTIDRAGFEPPLNKNPLHGL